MHVRSDLEPRGSQSRTPASSLDSAADVSVRLAATADSDARPAAKRRRAVKATLVSDRAAKNRASAQRCRDRLFAYGTYLVGRVNEDNVQRGLPLEPPFTGAAPLAWVAMQGAAAPAAPVAAPEDAPPEAAAAAAAWGQRVAHLEGELETAQRSAQILQRRLRDTQARHQKQRLAAARRDKAPPLPPSAIAGSNSGAASPQHSGVPAATHNSPQHSPDSVAAAALALDPETFGWLAALAADTDPLAGLPPAASLALEDAPLLSDAWQQAELPWRDEAMRLRGEVEALGSQLDAQGHAGAMLAADNDRLRQLVDVLTDQKQRLVVLVQHALRGGQLQGDAPMPC